MKTVIMAGGKGTRIASIAGDLPKPMLSIAGKPVLEREICCLRDQGYRNIIITIGHLGNKIIDYFEDGAKFGVSIEYYVEEQPMGNAGALFKIAGSLDEDSDDSFLLLNGDSIFDVDFGRMVDFHRRNDALATILVHPNSHPYDSGLVITDDSGKVKSWLTKEDERPLYYENLVNSGVHVISKQLLCNVTTTLSQKDKVDLDRDILRPTIQSGRIYAYKSTEYVKDMGTPERYDTVCFDYTKGVVEARNLRNKQKAIFIDRDGTINKYKGFISNIDDFELIDGVSEAIGRINSSAYLTIVVTNQPVVARGELSFKGLKEIHNKMETLLGREAAYIDDLFFCPHHPDSGFMGEIKELKFDCDCRKPKPGMLLKAAAKYNISLVDSWMIGDSVNDILAGKAAGCKTAYIGDRHDCGDIVPDYSGKDLREIVFGIIKD